MSLSFPVTRSRGLADKPRGRLHARIIKFARLARRVLRHPIGRIGGVPLLVIVLMAAAAPILPLQDPVDQNLSARLLEPSWQHWFGTDSLGRDILSRVVFGARPTLFIVAVVLLLSAPFGLVVGAAAGVIGGSVDRIAMRIGDVFMAFPRLVLALAIAAAVGTGASTAILAIALTGWPIYARLARSEAVGFARSEFVQAAETIGASRARIIFHHIVPLCVPSILVRAALDAPGIILITAGLGFLGLSLPPPNPEWGAMVADGRAVIFEQWWVATIPGLFILVLSLSFNLIGDALRDALSPEGP
ncbi:MAG: ABC transporter permease [Microvirga sp.]